MLTQPVFPLQNWFLIGLGGVSLLIQYVSLAGRFRLSGSVRNRITSPKGRIVVQKMSSITTGLTTALSSRASLCQARFIGRSTMGLSRLIDIKSKLTSEPPINTGKDSCQIAVTIAATKAKTRPVDRSEGGCGPSAL